MIKTASTSDSKPSGKARILDGKWLAAREKARLAQEVKQLSGIKPCLATILVGDDKASHTYVASKHRSAHEVGFITADSKLPASASADEIAFEITKYNNDKNVHGILLQLPLPAWCNHPPTRTVFSAC